MDDGRKACLRHYAQMAIAAGGITPGQVFIHADAIAAVGPLFYTGLHEGGECELNAIAGIDQLVTLRHEPYHCLVPEPLKSIRKRVVHS